MFWQGCVALISTQQVSRDLRDPSVLIRKCLISLLLYFFIVVILTVLITNMSTLLYLTFIESRAEAFAYTETSVWKQRHKPAVAPIIMGTDNRVELHGSRAGRILRV